MEPKRHHLKCEPEPFAAVADGRKQYEVRVNDRGFVVGDELWLREFDAKQQAYTGKSLLRRVTYMTPGGSYGLPEQLCVLGIAPLEDA